MIFQHHLLKSFAQHAAKTAIENNGSSLSYSQLLQQADAVTAFLLRAGHASGAVVGVRTADRQAIIVAMIGILNAGCVFVPLDPKLPAKRQQAILDALCPACLLATEADQPGTHQLQAIVAQPAPAVSYPAFGEDDSVYVYFTSGSTGQPKGIIGRNKSLLQYLLWQQSAFAIDAQCRGSQLISPYFDAFLRDVFVPLLSGGTVCLPPADEDFFTPAKLGDWLDRTNITHVHCVPSVFRLISEAAAPGKYAALRYVMMSGEKINPAELQHWYAVMHEQVQLVNFYGATESTMIRSFYLIQPADALKPKISIGTPIADTRLLVLDKTGKPCAPYMPGDLYIATPYLTKGYLGDDALTAEKFVTLFASTPQESPAFKTGDKARVLEAGKVELLGREDRQVKLHGIRVELDEIENTLLKSGLLKNALVFQQAATEATPEQPEVLMAFVIPAATTGDWKASLRHFLQESLPEYMIPAALHEVTEFPLLPNGKINYKKLVQSLETKTVAAPATAVEERLLEIWKEILGDKVISTQDSFQQAGGSSLSIMRLIAKIYKEYGVRVSLNDLFNNLTIEKQARLLAKLQQDESLKIKAVPRKAAYATSATQHSMYYQHQVAKDDLSYNMPMAWELTQAVDMPALLGALRALVARHESLRTRFMVVDSQLVQLVEDELPVSIDELVMPPGGIESLIRPFDLASAPLLRLAVVTAADNSRILFADMHHIICDGMSQVNLFADLLKLYGQEALPPLPLQYKDYAEWEQQFKTTDAYLGHRSFWLQAFEGKIPKLGWQPQHEAEPPTAGRTAHFLVPQAVVAPLLLQWQQQGITEFSGMLATYFLFLAQLTGNDDLVVGISSAGRMQDELEGVVGAFAKTLPIRQQLDFDLRFLDFAASVNQYLRQASAREAYNYIDIASDLSRSQQQPTGPLFETMFIFQNFEHRQLAAGKQLFKDYAFQTENVKYPLSFSANKEPGGYHFRVDYQLAYFSEEQIAQLTGRFQQLLATIATLPPEATLAACLGVETKQSVDVEKSLFSF